ncbi:benzoate diol dehydrogenase BenD [Acetobacter sacchari]|nr:benzoate diol dehydrogenase BenD [Acetobacter sacchari]
MSMIFQGRFTGKVLVVTGSAQGIGHAVASRAVAEGGQVMFVDRADFVDEVARSAARGQAGRTASISVDMETWKGAQDAMEAAHIAFGKIDIVINGVGGAIRMRPFHAFEAIQIEAEIRRSLMPTLWGCHAALPYLLQGGGGTIVNISSNATRGIHRVPYSAAKGGVNALTASLAMEYAESNIRIVAAAPGGTEAPPRRIPRNPGGDTPQEQVWMDEVVEQVKDSTFLKRYSTIEEQAAPILFLASDEASYITGSVLPVAGGDLG